MSINVSELLFICFTDNLPSGSFFSELLEVMRYFFFFFFYNIEELCLCIALENFFLSMLVFIWKPQEIDRGTCTVVNQVGRKSSDLNTLVLGFVIDLDVGNVPINVKLCQHKQR